MNWSGTNTDHPDADTLLRFGHHSSSSDFHQRYHHDVLPPLALPPPFQSNDTQLQLEGGWSVLDASVLGMSSDPTAVQTDPKYPGLQDFSERYSGVHGYIASVVCIWGIAANLANIVVLTRRKMISSTNVILTWLAVADLLTMSTFLPFCLHFYVMRDRRLEFPSTTSIGWIYFLVFNVNFSVVCHTVAIWLTITLAIFRYLCICYPTRGAELCSLRKAKMAVLAVYVCSAVVCVPNYMVVVVTQKNFPPIENAIHSFNYTTTEPTSTSAAAAAVDGYHVVDNNKNATAAPTSAAPEVESFVYYTVRDIENEFINTFNYWIQAFLIKLLPCVLLTALTVLLVVAMHDANVRRMKLKSQGRQDESDRAREHNRTTAMLLAVVGLFQLTELPQGVLTLCSIFIPNFFADVYWPLGDLLDIAALLNNSINFVLYCTMSRQFRDTFAETFGLRRCCDAVSAAKHTPTGGAGGRAGAGGGGGGAGAGAGWMKLKPVKQRQQQRASCSSAGAGRLSTAGEITTGVDSGFGGSTERRKLNGEVTTTVTAVTET